MGSRRVEPLSQAEKSKARVYIQTLVDVAREPFLILDGDLRVVAVNKAFCKTFKVTKKATEQKFVYDLGNKQWNIPKLKKLLEEILPKRKSLTGFDVEHKFPAIGQRVMLLNARQVDSVQLIILAFEDVTAKRKVEQAAKNYTKKLEAQVAQRTKTLHDQIKDLEELTQVMVGRELKMSELKREIARIKKLKKINGNNHS
jgi:PAS domain-containing protein